VIRRIAAAAPPPDLTDRYSHSFGREATNEVVFNLANVFLRPAFPRFNANRHYHPLLDYLSWLPKFAGSMRVAAAAKRVSAEIIGGKWPFHLVALQLQSDYQVRDNSPYSCISEMIEEVVVSFARNAPAAGRLVFKRHPLDNGLERWPARIRRSARRHGVSDRVLFIDGGRLDVMIARSEGVLAINSTVGLHGIRASKPVKILGRAVFDLPGLTHQGPLDGFWRTPEKLDPALARDFITAIAAAIQVKGSFYNPEGRAVAIAEIVHRVANGLVNAPRDAVPAVAAIAETRTRAA
jgi:capsular polysaccharide export protein